MYELKKPSKDLHETSDMYVVEITLSFTKKTVQFCNLVITGYLTYKMFLSSFFQESHS